MELKKLNLNIQFLLGSSSKKKNQISHAKGNILYVCGCYIIFYSPQLDQQIAYIKYRNSKISVIAVSPDEKYLAVAQSGKYPQISIYLINQVMNSPNSLQIQPAYSLKGHKNSIDLIKYSPNSRYLVSVCNNDGSLFIWEKDTNMSKNKISKPVNLLFFDWNQDLLTIGRGYIKLWKFQQGEIIRKKQGQCWMIQGKVLNFGKNFSTKDFIDAEIFHNQMEENSQKLILLSLEGFLCTISSKYEKVQKWIDLMMQNTSSLQIYGNLALCAGENSLIKIIDLVDLSLKGKFSKPPPLNKENISKDEELKIKENDKFPNCLGIMIFGEYILTLYENLTIFVWVMDQQIRAFRSIVTHREKINCVCLLQQIRGDICFFGTASEDNTLRIWHFYKKCYQNNRQSMDIAEIIGIKRNAYCKNLTRIIYTVSQHPIIQMKIYQKDYIVCISKQELLMYSLNNFQLTLHQSFSQQFKSTISRNPDIVLSIQVQEDLIYLGFQNGYLRIYKPSSQSLLKLKEIDFGQPINTLKIHTQRKMLIQGKNKAILYDFDNNSRNSFNNVLKSYSKDKYLYFGEQKKVILYNVINSKKIAELSLSHEFQPGEKIDLIRSNSHLIVILSTINRLLIVNLSMCILYSELMNEQITDLEVTENGELILVGSQGDIIIKVIKDFNLKQIENRARKWFEMNDMSWMDNSVWTHSKNHLSLNSNVKSRSNQISQSIQSEIKEQKLPQIFIQRAKSINFDQILGDQSVRICEKDVEIEYKNEENKMSVFNPSNIYKQVNQIYNNVNGMMKNLGVNNQNQKKNIIDFSGSIDEIQLFKSNNTNIPKQKKKIFQQQSQIIPKFTNNLVQSQFGRIQEDRLIFQNKQERSNEEKNQQKQIHNSFNINSNYLRQTPPSTEKTTRQGNQTLQYSVNLTDKEEQNVNNSLRISMSRMTNKNLSEKQINDQKVIQAFYQILESTKNTIQPSNQQHITNLVQENSDDFRRVYQVLNKIYGKKQNFQKKSFIISNNNNKQTLIQEYKKMSQNYLNFLQKNL